MACEAWQIGRNPPPISPPSCRPDESIKATGWISAETPHYLLGGTPISSNWFDKCWSIPRMRDEGRDREKVLNSVRFDQNRRLFPVANRNFWFSAVNFTILNSDWNYTFEQEARINPTLLPQNTPNEEETSSLFSVIVRELNDIIPAALWSEAIRTWQ